MQYLKITTDIVSINTKMFSIVANIKYTKDMYYFKLIIYKINKFILNLLAICKRYCRILEKCLVEKLLHDFIIYLQTYISIIRFVLSVLA